MEEFKKQLKRYLQGDLALEQLQETLTALVGDDLSLAPKISSGLKQMHERGILRQGYEELADTIESLINSEDATRIADCDATQIKASVAPVAVSNDETVIASPGEKREYSAVVEQSAERNDSRPVTQTGTSTSRWSKPFDASETEHQNLQIGSIIKDRFRLVEFIGCGGMGDVYKAEDQRRVDAQDIDTLVAIKVLNKKFRDHPESLRTLQREARRTQNLAHPNIVNVYDFDRDQHHVYMTMELMDGRPLNEIIKAHPNGMPLQQVLDYISGMADALGYAHHRGVVHSDFKPSNIFLDNNQIKVFDFGIARARSGIAHNDDFDAGELNALTPSYASPAMLQGGSEAHAEDDLYALGCIVYELLTGKHPFLKNGKKVAADEACNSGMKVAEIKQLSRKQNRALRGLLEFDADQRTGDVEQFLDQFMPQRQKHSILSRWYVWLMILGVIIGIAYFPVRGLWQQQQIDDFADDLEKGDEESIREWLDEIDGFDQELRDDFYSDTRVKRALTSYFMLQVSQYASQDDFDTAQFLAQRSLKIYEDSRRLSDKQQQIIKLKAERLNQFNSELNKMLDLPAAEFAASITKLRELLADIKRVDQQNGMLSDERIPVKFSEVTEQMISQNDYPAGQRVIKTGLELFPGNNDLELIQRNLQKSQIRYNRQQEIETRVSRLEQASVEKLEDYRALVPEMEALLKLDAGQSTLKLHQQELSKLLAAELSKLTEQQNWQKAQQVYTTFQPVLEMASVERFETQLAEQLKNYQQQIEQLITATDNYISNEQLQKAEQSLIALQDLQPDARTLVAVSDRVAKGWIKESRSRRKLQQWEGAKAALAKADQFALSAELKETASYENKQLAEEMSQSQQQIADAELEQLESEKQQELIRLQGKFEEQLSSVELSDSSTRSALGILDRIEGLDSEHPLLLKGEGLLAERYLQKAEASVRSDLDAAIRILDDGKRLLAGNQQISEKLEQLKSTKQLAQQNQLQVKQSELKKELEQLLNDNQAGQEELLQSLMSRAIVELDDQVYVQGIKTRAAIYLTSQVSRLSGLNEFQAAGDALKLARQYDPSLGTLQAIEEQLQNDQQTFQVAQEKKRGDARISGLKQTFDTQIKASALTEAKQTYSELKSLMSADDPFIIKLAPQAFQDTYVRMADNLAARNRFTQAAKLLESSSSLFLDQEYINEKVLGYRKGAALFHINRAIKQPEVETVEQAHGLLREFSEVLGQDKFLKLDQELQQSLVKQINGLKTKFPDKARELLLVGRKLYPDNRELPQLKVSGTVPTIKQPTVKPKVDIPVESSSEVQLTKPSNRKIVSPRPCTPSLAGKGSRSAAVCWDMLSAEDTAKAPYMIVIPNGTTFFAMSKFEISRADYNRYCSISGECSGLSGSEKMPVTGLSKNAISKYAAWLGKNTGHTYRLPSKNEWTLAANAGGGTQPQNYNCRLSRGSTILKGKSVVDVHLGKPNEWGLINHLGNAQELVTAGGELFAMGGRFDTNMSDCTVSMSVKISEIDSATGFRLVREM